MRAPPVVASGTATVEARSASGTRSSSSTGFRPSPMKLPAAVVEVPFVAMANLIAGKLVVPELIQTEFTAANIVRQIEPLLPDGPPRESHDAGAGPHSGSAYPPTR